MLRNPHRGRRVVVACVVAALAIGAVVTGSSAFVDDADPDEALRLTMAAPGPTTTMDVRPASKTPSTEPQPEPEPEPEPSTTASTAPTTAPPAAAPPAPTTTTPPPAPAPAPAPAAAPPPAPTPAPPTPAPPSPPPEAGTPSSPEAARSWALVNDLRAANGLPTLTFAADAGRKAQALAERMAAGGRLSHSPSLFSDLDPRWTRVTENVGVGASADAIHDLLAADPPHRANMLHTWTTASGVGAAWGADGRLYIAQIFVG